MELPQYDVPTMPFQAKPLETTQSRVRRAQEARKGLRMKGAAKGHVIGPTTNPASGRVHLPGSILAQLSQGEGLENGIEESNLRYQKIAGRGRRNILFIIDSSGSMVADDRFAKVKGCVVSLLESAYSKRVRVAIIGYGGGKARLVLPFTTSAELAAERIDELKGGGSTPMVDALGIAGNLLERMRDEDLSVYLLSDGRYNRNSTGRENWQIREFGDFCKSRNIPVTLIDAGSGTKTAKKRSAFLAGMLHAEYKRIDDLEVEMFNPEE